MAAFVIIQLVLQIFLKGLVEDLWGLYFTIQLCAYLTLYGVNMPSVTEMYVDQFRALVDFDIFEPDVFLPLLHKDWSL